MARRGSGKRDASTTNKAARLEVKGVELAQPVRPSGLSHPTEPPNPSAMINLNTSTTVTNDFTLKKLGPTKNINSKKAESSHHWQSPLGHATAQGLQQPHD